MERFFLFTELGLVVGFIGYLMFRPVRVPSYHVVQRIGTTIIADYWTTNPPVLRNPAAWYVESCERTLGVPHRSWPADTKQW